MTWQTLPAQRRTHEARLWRAGASALAVFAVLAGPSLSADAQTSQQTTQQDGDQADSAETEQAQTQLEEIVVTSRRYQETIQDAPVAVNVMSPDYLEKNRIQTIDQVMAFTPGATFTFFNKVNPEASIRGFQTATPGNASQEASIMLVVDDLVVSNDFMRARPLFDLERVEVLRGPQGTTFGRNASIGALQFVSARPTRQVEAGLTATFGNDQQFDIDGHVSGPLTDTLAGRFAFNFDSSDGIMESASTGQGLNGKENFALRGSLLFEPSDSLRVYAKAEYFEDNDQAPVRRSRDSSRPQILAGDDPRRASNGGQFQVPFMPPFSTSFTDPADPFKTEISEGDFFFDRQVLTLSGNIEWQVTDAIQVKSITGYMDGESDGLQDAIGTPENVLFQATANDGDQISQEIHINNHGSDSPLHWLAGFIYLHNEEHRFEENRFFHPTPGDPDAANPLPFPRVPTSIAVTQFNETDSIGAFGELRYDLTSKIDVSISGRWTRDEKDSHISNRGFGFQPILAGLTGCPAPPAGPIVCASPDDPAGFGPVSISDDWEDFMARGSIEYQVTPEHMIYFLGSQGFKAGGFQPDPRTPAAAKIPFGPERTLNFELGWKGQIGRQLRFSLTGFFMKLEDTQLNQFIQAGTGFFQIFSNAGRVESVGIEGDATWQVTSNLRIGTSFAAMDVELKDTVLLNQFMELQDFSGTRPDGAAKWTANGFAEYTFHLPWDGSSLAVRGDIRARSNIFDDLGELPFRKRPQLTQFGGRMTWTSADGRYSAGLWARNIFEDEDVLNIGPMQPNTLQPPMQFGNKRSFGGTLSIKY